MLFRGGLSLARRLARSQVSDAAASAVATSPLPVTVSVDGGMQTVQLRWDDGESSTFNALWLRTNCATNFHATGQRLQSPGRIGSRLSIASAHVCADGRELRVDWSDGGTASGFCLGWLRRHCYRTQQRELQSSGPSGTHMRAGMALPSVACDEVLRDDSARLQMLEQVNEYGLSLVTGVPCETGEVQRFAERALGIRVSHDLLYGGVFDVRDEPDPVNIAYTSLELEGHMDLAYYESPPGLQLLHCLRFDDCVRGGESTFIDIHNIAEMLRERDPESFRTLCRVPATFQKEHMERERPVLMRYQRPHISTNAAGEVIAVFWAPAFEGPLCVAEEEVQPYYDAYRAFEGLLFDDAVRAEFGIQHRLQNGELLVFNNRRLLHGRTLFDGGEAGVRHLQGTYFNIDEFVCSLRVLARKLGRPETLTRVGNGSFT